MDIINKTANIDEQFKYFSTNSVDCSIINTMPMPKKRNEEEYLKWIAENHSEKEKYKLEVCVDLGYNTTVAALQRNIKENIEVNTI